MLKLIALFLALTLTAVHSTILLGGYSDRPDLIQDAEVQGLVKYASQYLASTQNLVLNYIKIRHVQTQVVAGMNYKIDFTGQSMDNYRNDYMDCQTVIYVRFDGTKRITDIQCQPM